MVPGACGRDCGRAELRVGLFQDRRHVGQILEQTGAGDGHCHIP